MKNKKKLVIIQRNPVRTRNRILEKSGLLFAKNGYAGTPLSAILAAAKINKRMIYHYFGDKEGLYKAVFIKKWGELKSWFDQAFSKWVEEKGMPVSDHRPLLGHALELFFDFMASHREFVRLLMWEGLEGGHISRGIWADVRGPLFVQIEFLIKQVQKEGWISEQVDPGHLVISFLGAVVSYFGFASSIGDMIHKTDPLSPAVLTDRKKQIRLLMEGLYNK